MSYILSGVVVPDSVEGAQSIRDSLGLVMDAIPLSDDCSLLANRSRSEIVLLEEDTNGLVSHYGKVLTVLWDDQNGVREAKFYLDGNDPLEFGEEDELYVELDDDGYPASSGKIYTLSEVEECPDEKEFETCKNAIELGCEASGLCEPELLMECIRKQV